ncbi:MAG: hypothetical protein LBS07_04230 [Prevotellaceae bacterium]|jgi:hypothetical protein|nr:hypothetical protein [Prevotellaceae bacterium]
MNKKNIIILVAVLIILALLAVVLYFARDNKQKDQEMKELVDMMNFEKEQLENEFVDLTNEFGGYVSNLKNDSLIKLLDSEKLKVQQLLEELRITKATNARRISELKKELESVRKVMVHYVHQIDSLNVLNQRLTTENVEVRRKYQAASETVEQLSKEKETLHEVVSRASIMEISNFSVETLNKKDRKTSRLSQIATLQFNFAIAKNVTVQPGKKIVYLRITRPDYVVLTKGTEHVFPFEDKNIAYSAKKEIEYENETVQDAIYWKVEEILPAGLYRADFFLDGNRTGSFAFELKK